MRKYFTKITIVLLLAGVALAYAEDVENMYTKSGLARRKDEFVREHFERIKKAYDDGNHYAAFALGKYYGDGVLLKADYEKSIAYYKEAADLGIADACYNLGHIYRTFMPVADIAEAIKWYKKGAEAGHSLSAYVLGIIYAEDTRVPRDYNEADKWYMRSAEIEGGDEEIDIAYLYIADYRDTPLCEKGMSILRRHLKNNNPCAQYKYGVYLYTHKKDKEKGIYYLKKSAEQNFGMAYGALGSIYSGLPSEGDIQFSSTALKYFCKGAEAGNVKCQVWLGRIYYEGWYKQEDYAEAYKWFCRAADQNSDEAFYWLGIMYDNGLYVKTDHTKAADYFMKASQLGHLDARTELARMYHLGVGVPENVEVAYGLMKSSAAAGNKTAQILLKLFD